ncbi:MAG: phosphate regulon sensor histidine kinase PhoR [Pseudomonadota bacterium]
MKWTSTALRIALLLATTGLVGWYFGKPAWALCAVLLALVLHWLMQMRRVQNWLQQPQTPPPEIYGIWGDLLSRIYIQQKKGREAQARLQSTIDYLQDSFAYMRDGVIIVDEQGLLKWFNSPASELLSLREEDTGQILMNLVRAPEFSDYFNEGDFSEPLEYSVAGDTVTWVRIEITRFGDGDRLLFVRDITSAIRMEQVRRDFVANVSHELRTPLTVISGYLGTFLGDADNLDPRYRKAMGQMLQQAARMENLLKDLLWLSRIESGKGLEQHSLVSISALLAELLDELRSAEPERTVNVHLETEYQVLGDYRELYSAVSNLVWNALKYSPEDSPVEVHWRKQDGLYQLSVSDHGIGIDSMHIPRLTERFYRVEDSRSSATGGTGLGLAIVKHVAATHGAQLQIDSTLGTGSVFSLIFPDRGEIVEQHPTAASVA